jgi:hypothetical protein
MSSFSSPLILGGILLFLAIVLLMVVRIRSEQSLHEAAAPPPSTEDRPSLKELFPEPPDLSSGPSGDMISERVAEEGYSSQLQTASDNLRIESVGDRTRVIVNGVTYDAITAIPDRDMRRMAHKLYEKTFSGGLFSHRDSEAIRQVNIGNQKTIEARSPDYTVSVQEEGRRTRFIVNGLTYYSLNDIPEPDMRRKAKELLKKRV